MTTKLKISVIIPAYNSRNTIRQCLTSLRNQNYQQNFEIILVDSSDDGTDEIVKREFPEVTLIHLPVKTDPGKARQLGIENSRGSLILFIDSDCVAPEDWISQYEMLHQQYPNIAAIGGSVVNGREHIATSWAGYIAEFRDFIPQHSAGFVKHLPTLNISYKRWVFEKYGQFHNSYYPQEDLVFNYQLIQAGEKILFEPKIVVRHYHNPSFKAFLQHQKRIGKITAVVLQILPLEGAKIARNKWLFFIVAPVLPFVKFVRTILVFLKKSPTIIIKHPLAVILFAIGLVQWTIGFTEGVLKKRE